LCQRVLQRAADSPALNCEFAGCRRGVISLRHAKISFPIQARPVATVLLFGARDHIHFTEFVIVSAAS